MSISVYFDGLLVMLLLGFITWLASIAKKDVSIVDSLWSIMFLAAAVVYFLSGTTDSLKNQLILALVTIWAIRLSLHLTVRNWGEPEDRRYQQIRAKYQPSFAIKSLAIIFVFQAVLAWIVSLPLLAAMTANHLGWLDIAGLLLWTIGMVFESVADMQLSKFKANPDNNGRVLNTGLWRYSRHPNYFGECLVWWGFFVLALSSGAWWAIISPLLMTWLLLKFSGVVMLESDISERRPDYRAYIEQTNAFLPGPSKAATVTNTTRDVS